MLCRLCLCNLSEENAIELFGEQAETKLASIISKYFELEISPDDTISTKICHDCCEHLEDFHKFWIRVDAKQSTLRNEFLEIKCDVTLEDEVQKKHNDDGVDEEMLLDIKDVSLLEGELGPLEHEAAMENVEQDIKVNLADIDFNDDDDDIDNNDKGASGVSSDDDVPLEKLRAKVKKKVTSKSQKSTIKPSKPKRKKVRRSKVKEELTTDDSDATDAGAEGDIQAEKPESTEEEKQEKHVKKLRHADIISQNMILACDLCDHVANHYHDLRDHFLKEHKRRPYIKCCNKVFHKPFILADHVLFHQNPAAFQCDICKKNLRSTKCLDMHKKIKHLRDKPTEKPTLPCHKCTRRFLSQVCLDKHLEKHDTEQEYPCEICNKPFATAQRLRKHIESIHENIYHHVCDVCGKKFKFKPSFEKHVQEHNGIVEPPVQCETCGDWLKNKQSLRLHQFKHDKRETQCKFCGRICVSRTALRGHISYMHRKAFNLQCKYCEKTFKDVRNLEEHMAIHTGIQLYSCPHCAKECRSQSNMYVHIKRYHYDEWVKSKMKRSNNPNLNKPQNSN